MAPRASPNSKTLKLQTKRKKFIAYQRKSFNSARTRKLHHDEVVKVHLLASAETTHQMTRIGADLLDATIMQTASQAAAAAVRVQDVASIRRFLVLKNEDDGSVIVTKCAHLVVSVYQSQTDAKDTQMKRYQQDSGFANGDFTAVRDMAVDHALLVPNDAEDGLVFNTEFYDELVHSHKED